MLNLMLIVMHLLMNSNKPLLVSDKVTPRIVDHATGDTEIETSSQP